MEKISGLKNFKTLKLIFNGYINYFDKIKYILLTFEMKLENPTKQMLLISFNFHNYFDRN